MNHQRVTVADIERAHLRVAGLVLRDPAFAPVFARLEDELQAARELGAESDPVKRARALVASMERGKNYGIPQNNRTAHRRT